MLFVELAIAAKCCSGACTYVHASFPQESVHILDMLGLLCVGPDLEKGWYGTAAVAAMGTGNEAAQRPGLAARLARLRGISDFGYSPPALLHFTPGPGRQCVNAHAHALAHILRA